MYSTLAGLIPALIFTEALMWGYCVLRGWPFIRAKLISYRWVLAQWPKIQERRRLAESVRVISDWGLLKHLSWVYAWDRFVLLGRERGRSQRQPSGGLPREMLNG